MEIINLDRQSEFLTPIISHSSDNHDVESKMPSAYIEKETELTLLVMIASNSNDDGKTARTTPKENRARVRKNNRNKMCDLLY